MNSISHRTDSNIHNSWREMINHEMRKRPCVVHTQQPWGQYLRAICPLIRRAGHHRNERTPFPRLAEINEMSRVPRRASIKCRGSGGTRLSKVFAKGNWAQKRKRNFWGSLAYFGVIFLQLKLNCLPFPLFPSNITFSQILFVFLWHDDQPKRDVFMMDQEQEKRSDQCWARNHFPN